MNNREIPLEDENLKVLALGPTGILEVNPIGPNYFGTYTCSATNTLGKNTRDIELKQAHRPGPVAHTKVCKCYKFI